MSQTIDERVLSMKFDGDQFQKGIIEALASLNQLDNSLKKNTKATKFNSALKMVGGVFKAVKGTAGVVGKILSPIAKISKFTTKFVGDLTGINSLLSSQLSKIKETVASLTGGALVSGFEQYETKINSTRTILANVKKYGRDIDDVTAALEELNEYANQTIYSFGEMTSNVAKFTVAGVDLDKSVAAMEGISNLAAIQGVDRNAMARATYQISQAMAAGAMRLIDWRSLENSSMGGVGFQELAMDLARRYGGVNMDQYLKKHNNSFRETLQEGWFTTDLLTEAFTIYSGRFGKDFEETLKGEYKGFEGLSRVAKAFEDATKGNTEAIERYGLAITDLQKDTGEWLENEDAYVKILKAINETDITDLEPEIMDHLKRKYHFDDKEAKKYYDLAVEAARAAKEMTTMSKVFENLKDVAATGWAFTYEHIFGGINDAKYIWTGVGNELSSIIENAAKKRNEMLKEWRAKTIVNTIIDPKTGEKTNVLALFDAIETMYLGVKKLAAPFGEAFRKVFEPLTSDKLISWTWKFWEFATQDFWEFVESGKGLSAVTPYVEAFATALKFVKNAATGVVKGGFGLLSRLFKSAKVSEGFEKAGLSIKKFSRALNDHNLKDIGDYAERTLVPVVDTLGSAFAWLTDMASQAIQWFKELFKGSSVMEKFSDVSKWLVDLPNKMEGWAASVKKWLDSNKSFEKVGDWLKGAYEDIKGFFVGFKGLDFSEGIKEFGSKLKGFYDKVKPIVVEKYYKFIAWLKDFFLGGGITEDDKKTMKAAMGTSLLGGVFRSEDASEGVTDEFKEKFQSFIDGLKKTAMDCWNWAKGAGKTVGGWFSSAFTWITKTAAPAVWDGLKAAWDWIKGAAETVKEIVDFLLPILNSLGFFRLSSAILRIGQGFKTLSNSSSELTNSVSGFVTSFGASITNVMNNFSSSITTLSTGLAAGIKRATKALKWRAFAEVLKSMAKVFLSISALIAVMVGTIYVMSMMTPDQIDRALDNMKSLAIFAGGVLVFVAAMRLLSGNLKSALSIKLTFSSLVDMILALIGLYFVFKLFGKMLAANKDENGKLTDSFWETVMFIGGAMAALTIFGSLLNASAKNVKANGVLKMALSLIAIYYSIKLVFELYSGLSSEQRGDFWAAYGAISGLMLIMGGMLALSHLGKDIKPKNIISMSLCVALLSLCVKDIAEMAGDKSGRQAVIIAGAIIAGLMIAMGGMLALSKIGNKGTPNLTKILAMAVAIKILCGTLADVTDLWKNNSAGTVAIALGTIVAFMVGYNAMMNTMGSMGSAKAGIIAMVAITASIWILARQLRVLATYDWKRIAAACTGMAAVFAVFVGAFVVLGKLNWNWRNYTKTFVSLILIVSSAFAIFKILEGLMAYDTNKLVKTTLAFGATFAALVAGFVIMGHISHNTIMNAGVNFAMILGAFALLGLVFGTIRQNLADYESFEQTLEDGKGIMERIGESMGSFFGSIVGGAVSSAAGQLGQLATDISTFGTNLTPFVENFLPKLKKVDDKSIKNLAGLAGAIALLVPSVEKIDVEAEGTGIFGGLRSLLGFGNKQAKGIEAKIDFEAQRAQFSEYASGIDTILSGVTEFVDAASKWGSDEQANFTAATEAFKNIVGALNQITDNVPLDSINVTAGGGKGNVGFASGGLGVSAGGGGGTANIQFAKYTEYASGIYLILAGMRIFMKACESKNFNKDNLTVATKSFGDIVGALGSVDLQVANLHAGGGGGGVLSGVGGLLAVGEAKIQYNTYVNFATAIATILDGMSKFIQAADDIKGNPSKITIATNNVRALITALDDVDLQITDFVGGGGGFAAGVLIGGGTWFKKNSYEAFGNAIKSITEGAAAMVKAIGDAYDKNPDIASDVNTTMTKVTELTGALGKIDLSSMKSFTGGAGLLLDGFVLGVGTTFKKQSYEAFGQAVKNIYDGAAAMIKAAGDISDESVAQKLPILMANVTNLTNALGEVDLSVMEDFKAGVGVLADNWMLGAGTTFKKQSYEAFGQAVKNIYDGASSFVTAAKDIAPEKAGQITSSLDKVKELVGAVSGITLQTEDFKVNAGVAIADTVMIGIYAHTESTKMSEFASAVDTIIGASSDFIAQIAEMDTNAELITSAMGSLTGLVTAVSNVKLPEESSLKSSGFRLSKWLAAGDYANVEKTKFEDLVKGLQDLIGTFNSFNSNDETSKFTVEDARALRKKMKALSRFLTSIGSMDLPTEFSVEKVDTAGTYVKQSNTSFGTLVENIGELFTSTQKFMDDVSTLTGEKQTGISYAFTELKGFLESLNGYELPTSWKVSLAEGIESFYDLGDISDDLPRLGKALSAFYINIDEKALPIIERLNSNISAETYQGSSHAATFLAGVFNLFSTILASIYSFTRISTYGDINSAVGNMEEFLNTVATVIDALDAELEYSNLMSPATLESIGRIGKFFVKNIAEGFATADYDSELDGIFTPVIGKITSVLDGFSPEFSTSATGLANAFKQGLVDGFSNLNTELSTGGNSELSLAFQMLSELLENAVNTDLTIRPVLDTADLETQITNLNSLTTKGQLLNFGRTKSNIKVASDLSVDLKGEIGRVVTAVNDLGPKIDTVATNVKNIRLVVNQSSLASGLNSLLGGLVNKEKRWGAGT